MQLSVFQFVYGLHILFLPNKEYKRFGILLHASVNIGEIRALSIDGVSQGTSDEASPPDRISCDMPQSVSTIQHAFDKFTLIALHYLIILSTFGTSISHILL